MDKKELKELVNESRNRMHQLVDKRCDELLDCIENGTCIFDKPRMLSLSSPPFLFKGEKPSALVMKDGQIIPTNTWKSVATTILKACNDEPEMHKRLMNIRGSVAGRSRFILTGSPDEMNVPLKIDEELYFEGKFDSEYLMKMMTERVLKPIGYDYSDINIMLRPNQHTEIEDLENTEKITCEDENEGFTIQMM